MKIGLYTLYFNQNLRKKYKNFRTDLGKYFSGYFLHNF